MKIVASCLSKYLLPIVAAVGFTVPAFATSGENAASVRNTYVLGTTGAMDFQITLTGLNTLCPGHNFVYINQNDPNYATIVANITAARGFGSTVYVYWTTDAGGYCHITEIYY